MITKKKFNTKKCLIIINIIKIYIINIFKYNFYKNFIQKIHKYIIIIKKS
jgi:hypothetical protein